MDKTPASSNAQESTPRQQPQTESIVLLRRAEPDKRVKAPCELRRLSSSDVPGIMRLQERIVEGLTHKGLFHPDTDDFYYSVIASSKNLVEGIFHDGKLVAFSLLYVPGSANDNLGKDIGLSPEELSSVAHVEMVFVDPSFWGNKLQMLFVKRRVEFALNHGHANILVTVDPSNKSSLGNLQNSGFVIIKPNVTKYGGKLRHIMRYQPDEERF